MNGSQKLAIMRMRAKAKAQEAKQKHEQGWSGQEPVLVDSQPSLAQQQQEKEGGPNGERSV